MSVLKMYLSQEDNLSDAELVEAELGIEIPEAEPVTEEEVYEAEAVLEETTADQIEAEREIEEITQVQAEAESRIASLENICEVLQYGLESEQYSPQMAAVVHAALEEYSELFGEEKPKVSLENYSHDNLEEFYRLALEDFTEKLYKLGISADKAVLGALPGLVHKAKHLKRNLVASSLKKKADKLLGVLSEVETTDPAVVSLKGLKARIAVKGSVPNNIANAAKADQRVMGEILNKTVGEGLDYLDAISKVAEDSVAKIRANKDREVGSAIEGVLKMTRPEDKIAAVAKDGSVLLGNVKIELGEIKNAEGTRDKLRAQAARPAPKFVKLDGEPTGPDELKLSKSDIAAILNLVKAYAIQMEKANDNLSSSVKNLRFDKFIESRYIKNEGDTFRKFFGRNKELQALGELVLSYTRTVAGLYNGAFAHSTDSAKALLALAQRAVSTLNASKAKEEGEKRDS